MFTLWKFLLITTFLATILIIPRYAKAPVESAFVKIDNVLAKVINCESGNNPQAYNPRDIDGRPKYGLLQYDEKTFYEWAKKAGIEKPNIWEPVQQIQVYHYAAKKGLLRHWGCFTKLFP